MEILMMTGVGLLGAILSGYAYVPQITHLAREKCSDGISRPAYVLWLAASLLVTANALYIQSPVFIFLGVVQIFATATISYLSRKYRGQVCEFHIEEARRIAERHSTQA